MNFFLFIKLIDALKRKKFNQQLYKQLFKCIKKKSIIKGRAETKFFRKGDAFLPPKVEKLCQEKKKAPKIPEKLIDEN